MDYFIYNILQGLLLVTLLAILPIILIYFLVRKKSNSKWRWIIISTLSTLQLWVFYSIYIAFYPQDSFYFEEYATVVGRPAPTSAEIINKIASYPDIHGSYSSVSLLKLSNQDHIDLYREISQNNYFEGAELIYSETLIEILNSTDAKNIVWKQRKKLKEDINDYFIGFLSDQKSIIVYYLND